MKKQDYFPLFTWFSISVNLHQRKVSDCTQDSPATSNLGYFTAHELKNSSGVHLIIHGVVAQLPAGTCTEGEHPSTLLANQTAEPPFRDP